MGRGIDCSHACIISILSHEMHLRPQELGHAVVGDLVGDGNGIACGYFGVRAQDANSSEPARMLCTKRPRLSAIAARGREKNCEYIMFNRCKRVR